MLRKICSSRNFELLLAMFKTDTIISKLCSNFKSIGHTWCRLTVSEFPEWAMDAKRSGNIKGLLGVASTMTFQMLFLLNFILYTYF